MGVLEWMALEQMDLELLGPHPYIYTNKFIYIWVDIDAFDLYKCLCINTSLQQNFATTSFTNPQWRVYFLFYSNYILY